MTPKECVESVLPRTSLLRLLVVWQLADIASRIAGRHRVVGAGGESRCHPSFHPYPWELVEATVVAVATGTSHPKTSRPQHMQETSGCTLHLHRFPLNFPLWTGAEYILVILDDDFDQRSQSIGLRMNQIEQTAAQGNCSTIRW